MRHKGTLIEWQDDRGFGFIEPAEGGSRVFCHIKVFEVRVRRPLAGDRVTYEVVTGADGRTSATHVRPVGLEEASYQSNVGSKIRKDRQRAGARPSKSRASGLLVVLLVGVVGYYAYTQQSVFHGTSSDPVADAQTATGGRSDDVLRRAFEQRLSDVQVQGSGVVERVLPDDTDGSRHQRFIVRLASGQTVLIAHNIDLAPRVPSLAKGDRIEFYGEYEWNDKGGVIHWTHHDPQGRHESGWISHGGNTYR